MNIAEEEPASDSASALQDLWCISKHFGIIIFTYLNGAIPLFTTENLSLLGGPSLTTYSISLLIEGISFAVILPCCYYSGTATTD
jgi:hypothetical protein